MMVIKLMDICTFQPTDFLRKNSMEFFGSLSLRELDSLKTPLPQILWSPIGPLIADGNNRLTEYASRGYFFVQVDYADETSIKQNPFILSLVLENARKLKKIGIRSVLDFYKSGFY